MNEKLIEKLNDYFVINGEPNIIENLELFYELSKITVEVFDTDIKEPDFKFTNCTLEYNKKLIEDFYKKYELKNNINENIIDGTIGIEFKTGRVELGGTQYSNPNRIEICSNGIIVDSAIAIHELSHLYDMPDDLNRNAISDLLTEAIAYTYEDIFLDYISSIGYKEDALACAKLTQIYMTNLSKIMQSVYRLMILYKNFSDIKKDSYDMYFNETKNYEKDIEISEKNIDNISNIPTWYTFAIILKSYMFNRFKEDSNFINSINELHDSINSKDMLECLKIIGLSDLGDEDKKVLRKYLEKDRKKYY